jgi:flagellar protein FlaG
METKAALTPPISEPTAPTSASPFAVPGQLVGGKDVSAAKDAKASKEAPAAAAAGPQPGDLRLVIEEDPTSGTYVYKTVDRRTGDVLQQFPREDVLRFKQAEHYDPGEVFDGLT